MPPARIYLDANATTTPLPEVVEAVRAALTDGWGNPSSLHASGRDAGRALSTCRSAVGRWLGAASSEVTFTGGGTEADRLAILGALAAQPTRRHVVAAEIEHPAIRDLLREAGKSAWGADLDVTWVRPGADGRIDPDAFASALRDDTALAALMWANNETGVLQPVHESARACRERGVPLLVDAVQAAGRAEIDFGALGAAYLVVSAHKVHGPKGVGALLVRSGAPWKAPFPASHEMRRRAGTEPTPLIAGFAAAATAVSADAPAAAAAMTARRDRLERIVCGTLGDVVVNGTAERIPNTTNLSFTGLAADRLLALLDRAGVDASNGSACTSGAADPSHVLLAMGRNRRDALAAIRFSASRLTTDADVDGAAGAVIEAVETLRRRARSG